MLVHQKAYENRLLPNALGFFSGKKSGNSALSSSRYEIGNLRLNVSVPNLHSKNKFSLNSSITDQSDYYGIADLPGMCNQNWKEVTDFKEVATTQEDSTRKDEPNFSVYEATAGLSS